MTMHLGSGNDLLDVVGKASLCMNWEHNRLYVDRNAIQQETIRQHFYAVAWEKYPLDSNKIKTPSVALLNDFSPLLDGIDPIFSSSIWRSPSSHFHQKMCRWNISWCQKRCVWALILQRSHCRWLIWPLVSNIRPTTSILKWVIAKIVLKD